MSTDTSSSSSPLPQILTRDQHDTIVSRDSQLQNTSLVIIVTSSTPASKSLFPRLVELSRHPDFESVKWYEMPMIAETTPMIKFGVQNCPVVVLMRGEWARTLLGIRGVEEVERGVREMVGRGLEG